MGTVTCSSCSIGDKDTWSRNMVAGRDGFEGRSLIDMTAFETVEYDPTRSLMFTSTKATVNPMKNLIVEKQRLDCFKRKVESVTSATFVHSNARSTDRFLMKILMYSETEPEIKVKKSKGHRSVFVMAEVTPMFDSRPPTFSSAAATDDDTSQSQGTDQSEDLEMKESMADASSGSDARRADSSQPMHEEIEEELPADESEAEGDATPVAMASKSTDDLVGELEAVETEGDSAQLELDAKSHVREDEEHEHVESAEPGSTCSTPTPSSPKPAPAPAFAASSVSAEMKEESGSERKTPLRYRSARRIVQAPGFRNLKLNTACEPMSVEVCSSECSVRTLELFHSGRFLAVVVEAPLHYSLTVFELNYHVIDESPEEDERLVALAESERDGGGKSTTTTSTGDSSSSSSRRRDASESKTTEGASKKKKSSSTLGGGESTEGGSDKKKKLYSLVITVANCWELMPSKRVRKRVAATGGSKTVASDCIHVNWVTFAPFFLDSHPLLLSNCGDPHHLYFFSMSTQSASKHWLQCLLSHRVPYRQRSFDMTQLRDGRLRCIVGMAGAEVLVYEMMLVISGKGQHCSIQVEPKVRMKLKSSCLKVAINKDGTRCAVGSLKGLDVYQIAPRRRRKKKKKMKDFTAELGSYQLLYSREFFGVKDISPLQFVDDFTILSGMGLGGNLLVSRFTCVYRDSFMEELATGSPLSGEKRVLQLLWSYVVEEGYNPRKDDSIMRFSTSFEVRLFGQRGFRHLHKGTHLLRGCVPHQSLSHMRLMILLCEPCEAATGGLGLSPLFASSVAINTVE